MRVAILGGGITGLTAAYTLSKAGHTIDLYEKSPTLGGLAQGFRADGWEWPLEYAYHHLFANDNDIIDFSKEMGFDRVFFQLPQTNSLYSDGDNYRIIPVDSPQHFLKFPLLPMADKVRAAVVLAILKVFPMLPMYERLTSEEFVKRYMGERMWNVFFQELFRKKFGKYAGKILAAFLWARIHKRTQKLGYIRGGFQSFVDHVEEKCTINGAQLHKGTDISEIRRKDGTFMINGKAFDAIISTLPSAVLAKVGTKVLTKQELIKFSSLSFLHARVLILETDKPILRNTYWLNICTPKIPAMIVAQHTNFIDKKHYGGRHIAYVGWYQDQNDEIMKLSKEELVALMEPHLHKIQDSKFKIQNSYSFVGPFAQPIFDKAFLKNKPNFTTSVPGLYIANLDMTYPYDRGTNYAVKLGKEVCSHIAPMS
jgi:protoporphyrinogen oxidase